MRPILHGWYLVVLFAGASVAATNAQQVAPAVSLTGVVVNADTSVPLRRARLDVNLGRTRLASVLSDAEGTFSVRVPEGVPLSLRVSKAGYATLAASLTVPRDAGRDPLRVELTRGAAISGRVVQEAGEPSIMLPIMVRRLGPVADDAAAAELRAPRPGVLVGSDVTPTQFAVTIDERGEFRIGGLSPGRYEVVPFDRESLERAGMRIEPAIVTLQPGSETAGVMLTLPLPPRREPTRAAVRPGARGSSIAGRITTAAGQPVAGALIRVRGAQEGPATTDADGRYAVTGLPAGSFTIHATKPGHAPAAYGRRGTALPPLAVTLRDREHLEGIDFTMVPAPSVVGVVIDEFGEPVQDVPVQMLRVISRRGGAAGIRQPPMLVRPTDDRGQFRIPDVDPGTYLIAAMPPPEMIDGAAGPREAYAPAYYYPGTTEAAAAIPIEIRSDDVVQLTMTMQPVAVRQLTGIAVNSAGQPFRGSMRVMPRSLGALTLQTRQLNADAEGRFTFTGIPEGAYVVQASGPGIAGTESAARTIIIGASDPEPLMVRTAPGAAVSGRIVLEDAPDGTALGGYAVSIAPEDSSPAPSYSSTASGPIWNGTEFTIFSGLAGPMRLRFASNDASWYLKAIRIDGTDIADEPFDFGFDGRTYDDVEAVFSRAAAEISGTATDHDARPLTDYAVAVFATDRARWFPGSRWLKLVRSSPDGQFRASGLPPGDYWVAAVDRIHVTGTPGEWEDADLLEMLASRGTRVLLGAWESQRLSLRVIDH